MKRLSFIGFLVIAMSLVIVPYAGAAVTGSSTSSLSGSELVQQLCQENNNALPVCPQNITATGKTSISGSSGVSNLTPVKIWYNCVTSGSQKMCVPVYAKSGQYATAQACLNAGCYTTTTNNNSGYNCVNGSCQYVSNGASYSDYSTCRTYCQSTTAKYYCNLNAGVYSCDTYPWNTVPGKIYNSQSLCLTNCNGGGNTTTKYSCNQSTGQCYEDSNGSYTSLSTCNSNCQASPRYSCNQTNYTCYQSSSGIYASASDCTDKCKPSISFNCVNGGCQQVNNNSGQYGTITACQSSCTRPKTYYKLYVTKYTAWDGLHVTYHCQNVTTGEMNTNFSSVTRTMALSDGAVCRPTYPNAGSDDSFYCPSGQKIVTILYPQSSCGDIRSGGIGSNYITVYADDTMFSYPCYGTHPIIHVACQ